MKRFVTTKGAAEVTGLSQYELRMGFKEGRYPALEIGRGDRRRSLRWDLDALEEVLRSRMMRDTSGEGR